MGNYHLIRLNQQFLQHRIFGQTHIQIITPENVIFAKSFICNLKKLSTEYPDILSRTLFIATDVETYMVLDRFRSNFPSWQQTYLVALEILDKQTNIKYWSQGLILALMENNINVFLSFPNSVWFSSPFEYLKKQIQKYDFLAVDANYPNKVPSFNFLYLKSTNKMLDIWTDIIIEQRLSSGNNAKDDLQAENLKQTLLKNGLMIHWVDHFVVSTGRWYEDEALKLSENIIVINDWEKTTEDKIRIAKKNGHWFLADDEG